MKKTLRPLLASLAVMATLAGPVAVFAESSASESASSSASAESSTPAAESTIDWTALGDKLKAATGAQNVTLSYNKNTPYTLGKDQVTETVNGYALYTLQDFSSDFKIPFDDQTKEGAVLVLDVTLKNDSDKEVYTTNTFSGAITGYQKALSVNKNFFGDEDTLTLKVSKAGNKVAAKSEVHGYVAFPISPEALKQLQSEPTVKVEHLVVLANENDKPSDALIPNQPTFLPISKEGESKQAAAGKFYADKLTAENWGTKTLISEKTTPQTVNFEGIDVTLNGYQVVDFAPNSDQAARFDDFKDGVVVLTAELTVKNNGKETLKATNTAGYLVFNDQLKLAHEGLIETKPQVEDVAPGQEYTYYLAFVYSKDDYNLYKDRSLHLNVHLYNKEFKALTKLDDIDFDLTK